VAKGALTGKTAMLPGETKTPSITDVPVLNDIVPLCWRNTYDPRQQCACPLISVFADSGLMTLH
jgi:hypothetical protein